MRKIGIAAGVVVLGLSSPTYADLGSKIAAVGDWTIVRKTDPMTDAPSCVGLYKGDPGVQLDYNSIAFGLRGKGGVSSYQLRWDDNPPSGMQLPSESEKEISAIVLQDDLFAPALSAKRLRVQVLTVLSSIVDFDVNLTTAQQAIAILSGPQCRK